MLYVTTRSKQDVYTAQRALLENRASDGGFYVPFRHPAFDASEIDALGERTFNQNVALILNRLFGTKLSGWDVDFAIGRYPVRVTDLHHRIHIAESWHNPQWVYSRVEQCLADQLGISGSPSDWLRIGIRIAVLFGIYGELIGSKAISRGMKMDVSVVSGDFSAPMSIWYARTWGLPVGNIICCCNENSEIWNLICHGQFRTDVIGISTAYPMADITLPADLERLIYECGGEGETSRYLELCRSGRMYCPDDETLAKLRDGLFISVVSSKRIRETIPNVYGTHSYMMSSYTALAYAGLLDYRVKKQESGHAVVLSEISPVGDSENVSAALGISVKDISTLI